MNERIQQLTSVWEDYKKREDESKTETIRKILADSVGFLLIECRRLTLNAYQVESRKTAIYPTGHGLDYCALKLASEAGEVAGKAAKRYRDDNGQLTETRRQQLKSELGDVLWYVAAMSHELDFSLEEVAQANLTKLQDRVANNVLKGDGDDR